MTALKLRTRCVRGTTPDVMTVGVHFAASGAATDQAISSLDQFFRAVAEFGSIGGFAGDSIPPEQSSIMLRGRSDDLQQASWQFDHVRVDPGLLGLFENIVRRTSAWVAPIDELTVSSSMCRHPERLPRSVFPPTRSLPFRFENLSDDRRVVVSIEFIDPQSEANRQRFMVAWEAWVKLTESGAFSDETHDVTETGVIVADLPQSVPSGMMFRHERVRLPDFAFDCLVNAFACLHSRIAPLEEVVIA